MDIIKRLFSFNGDDESAIGLCKFSEEFYKLAQSQEQSKRKFKKETNLTQLLKKSAY